MDIVEVKLGERSYPIFIGNDLLKDVGKKVRKYVDSKQAVIVTNVTVAPLYLHTVQQSLEESGIQTNIIELPDGEEYKSLKWAGKIFDKLISFGMDRYSPLIALGGGVIGDITGFVAATYLRGVPFIQVPTTLLAQVDSSVGGKTAVNHRKGKNLIGAFYQPKFVCIDIDTLKTLEERELRSGLAEVIKYGVIKDAELFKFLEENVEKVLTLDSDVLIHIILRSCAIKAEIVQEDETESGLRAILNFGHTFGHALESVTEYREYKHGEAVAIGMVVASKIANLMDICNSEVVERVRAIVIKSGLPWELPDYKYKHYLRAIRIDKKVVGDSLNFILTSRIGSVMIKEVKLEDCASLLNKLDK